MIRKILLSSSGYCDLIILTRFFACDRDQMSNLLPDTFISINMCFEYAITLIFTYFKS